MHLLDMCLPCCVLQKSPPTERLGFSWAGNQHPLVSSGITTAWQRFPLLHPPPGTIHLPLVLLSLTKGLQFLCCRINCIDQPSSAPVQSGLLHNHKPLTTARPVLRLKKSAVGIQPGLPIWECPKATKPPQLCGLSEPLTGIWTVTDHHKQYCKSHVAGKKWWLFFARIWFLFLLNFNVIINVLRDCLKNRNSCRSCLGGSGLWKCSHGVSSTHFTQGMPGKPMELKNGKKHYGLAQVYSQSEGYLLNISSLQYQGRALALAESTDGHFHKCWALPLLLKRKFYLAADRGFFILFYCLTQYFLSFKKSSNDINRT